MHSGFYCSVDTGTSFGDGGILAFGVNCFNMAFILPYLGFFLYKPLKKTGMRKLSMAIGSYIGINAASFAAVGIWYSATMFKNAEGQALYCPYPLSVSIPAMMIGHISLFGLAEIILTVVVLTFVEKLHQKHWMLFRIRQHLNHCEHTERCSHRTDSSGTSGNRYCLG